MQEPFRTQFASMLREHAVSRDVHDASTDEGFASGRGHASDAFVRREIERVETHRRSLVPLLARVGRARRILDFGCGSGGSTVALAMSDSLAPEHVVGVDVNASAVAAARVRAASYTLRPQVDLRPVERGALPFPDGEFDLVVTVSVLEFITRREERRRIVDELARVLRPGGHLYIATPRRWIREYHSRRWLGDQRHEDGFPWSSSAREIRSWLLGWERIPLHDELAALASTRRFGGVVRLGAVRRVLPLLTRWNKLLFRRPCPAPTGHA